MREVDLEELQELIRQMPVMAEVHPISLAFLPDEVRLFDDPWQMAAELDTPTPQSPDPMLATHIASALQHRFPVVRCTHDPMTTELNRVLLRRFEFLKTHMLCQSCMANEIACRTDADAIALMLVDGLSYADLRDSIAALRCPYQVQPVLVDGVSITEQGMLRLIGQPSLVQRLFDAGFRTCLGFTYWERATEPITDRLFAGFGDRVHRVKSFDEVLAALTQTALRNAFVQIVRTGLDGIAHRQRDKPNIAASVADILADFERLTAMFEQKGLNAWVHLVSDHGILWTHEHTLQPYELSSTEHPRYYEYAKSGMHVLGVAFEGKDFAMLEYPYLRRELRANEWGVHGGLSFEESVVPWISCRFSQHEEGSS
jgi:hypothetical protein